MKLRFGIDPAALAQIRARLDALCAEPPVGRLLSYVYLDTPDGDLAAHGMALRFRRSAALGAPATSRPWRRQEIAAKAAPAASIKSLGIRRLKERLDATFSVRIERWTWRSADGVISLDTSAVSTGAAEETFTELRIVCKKKHADRAMTFAVELGATRLSSVRARERGLALLGA